MIPDSVIEEIKSKNEISSVISAYVSLKKAGSNMQGLCPFHNEKTPSFTVFESTQSFHCFGCGAGGDVITFIRKIENLTYVEAIRFLAAKCGINIPEGDGNHKYGVRKSRILEMNKAAARFFHTALLYSDEAKAYLVKRGLSKSTVNHFGLGYAPGRNELIVHMKKLGYTEEELTYARLAGKNEKGIFSFFRNRLMFPIIDTSGSVIGFGGRIIDNSSKSKYLNTPETIAFNKGKNLFAMNYAKDYCKDEIIICEGYMDVIALHAAGFKNAVASLGTALTKGQAELIKRYTVSGKAILSYDSDGAGKEAANKGFRILTENGLDVRILRIKGAKDPDEYIKNYGADAFRELLKSSENKFDFIMNNILSKYDILTDEGKIKAANLICAEIAAFNSSVERELYAERASKRLGISKESIASEIKKQAKKKMTESTSEYKKKLHDKAIGLGDRINPERSANLKAATAEEAILGIMMLYPERMKEVFSGKSDLTEDDFVTSFNKRVFISLKKMYEEGNSDVGVLGEIFTEEEMGRIYEMKLKRNGLESSSDEVFSDNISALKAEKAVNETDIEKIIKAKLSGKNTDK